MEKGHRIRGKAGDLLLHGLAGERNTYRSCILGWIWIPAACALLRSEGPAARRAWEMGQVWGPTYNFLRSYFGQVHPLLKAPSPRPSQPRPRRRPSRRNSKHSMPSPHMHGTGAPCCKRLSPRRGAPSRSCEAPSWKRSSELPYVCPARRQQPRGADAAPDCPEYP